MAQLQLQLLKMKVVQLLYNVHYHTCYPAWIFKIIPPYYYIPSSLWSEIVEKIKNKLLKGRLVFVLNQTGIISEEEEGSLSKMEGFFHFGKICVRKRHSEWIIIHYLLYCKCRELGTRDNYCVHLTPF